jgi:hypothetical protein
MLTSLANLYCPKDFQSLSIRHISLNITGKLSLFPTSSPGLEPRTVFWFVILLPVISSPKQLFSWRHSIIMLSFRGTETTFTGNRIQDNFRDCGLCFCNLLFGTNNFDLRVTFQHRTFVDSKRQMPCIRPRPLPSTSFATYYSTYHSTLYNLS